MKKINCIEWTFDTESELDGYNPLGKVKICGREGFIQEDCTYVDAFLEALVKGISQIPEICKFSVDPIVEPNDINFEYVNNLLKISYGSQTVIVDNFGRLKQSLFDNVQKLVEQLDKLTDEKNQERRQLRYLREYLQESKPTYP